MVFFGLHSGTVSAHCFVDLWMEVNPMCRTVCQERQKAGMEVDGGRKPRIGLKGPQNVNSYSETSFIPPI